MKIRKNNEFMYQEDAVKKNMLIYYLLEKKAKSTMFLSKTLIDFCKVIHYIVEEKPFLIIAYKILV